MELGGAQRTQTVVRLFSLSSKEAWRTEDQGEFELFYIFTAMYSTCYPTYG